MSHVDKGALHAYLDGALDEYPVAEAEQIREHVDQCVECAIRLEAERRVRLDAQTILGMAAPEVDMPSLEELRAYVKRTRESRPASTTRIYRMGWAASVLLAVGAGWTLRGGQLQDAGLMSGAFQGPVAEAMAPARSNESMDRVAAAEVSVADDAVLEEAESFVGAGAVGASGLAAGGVATREARRVSQAEPTAVADAGAFERAATPPQRNDLPSAPLDAEKIRLSAEADIASRPTLDDAGASNAAMDVLAETVVLPPPGALDGVTAAVDAPAAAEVASEPDVSATVDTDAAERRRAESLVPVTSAMTRSTLSGQRQAEDEETAASEEPALMVEGYDFVSMVNMGEGRTPVGVHVVQRYSPDINFEIFHLEAGVEVDVLPPAVPGDAMVRTQTERGWIVVRGPLSETELQELLDGLFLDPETGVDAPAES